MINRRWIGLFVGFLVILNGLFIGTELYKETIRNQWASHQLLANQAFLELDRLNSWTVVIESTLSISIIIIAVWLIIKKESYLKNFIIISVWTQLVFLVIGFLFATYFQIATFNLVQQLLGPSFILGVLTIYQIIKKVRVRLVNHK